MSLSIGTNYNYKLDNMHYFRQNPANIVQKKQQELTKGQKAGILATTTASVLASMALLAKIKHYPLSPKKILNTPFKDQFFIKEEFGVGKILTMGAASCAGGLLGGKIFDKNKDNAQAKKRETLIQYTNISLPILTVWASSKLGEFITTKMPKALTHSNSKILRAIGQSPKVLTPLAGLGAGVYIGNRASNKINQKIFKSEDDRPVKLSDFSVHIDDACMAAQYIAPNNVISKGISRIIPFALLVPGYEIGKKQEPQTNKQV